MAGILSALCISHHWYIFTLPVITFFVLLLNTVYNRLEKQGS